jgi:spore germination protein D
MMKGRRMLLLALMGLTFTGCTAAEESGGELDYEKTKKMVVDILKTDDGKKAIQELMADDKMKEQLVMDQKVVSDTIVNTLTSKEGKEFWRKNFEDPKFAESVAKSMKAENSALLKDLMKDPEYKGMMIEVLKDPELEKEVTKLLKSKEYREHLQKVITETLESPLFKVKMQDILIKAAEEMKGSKEGDSGSDGGSGSGGGGQ